MTVLDTHAAIWWLAEPDRLSKKAQKAIQAAASAGELALSAASILEIATLVRRGRLQLTIGVKEWLSELQALPELRIEPVTAQIAECAGSFDAEVQGDPIDRLIIATAFTNTDSLVSADRQIHSLTWIRTIW